MTKWKKQGDGFVPIPKKHASTKQRENGEIAGEAMHCLHNKWVAAGKPDKNGHKPGSKDYSNKAWPEYVKVHFPKKLTGAPIACRYGTPGAQPINYPKEIAYQVV